VKFSFLSLTIGCSTLLALGLSQSPSIAATVTVHFPRMPMSGQNFEHTHTVRRSTSNPLPDVGALQNLFQGPTRTEIANAPRRPYRCSRAMPATVNLYLVEPSMQVALSSNAKSEAVILPTKFASANLILAVELEVMRFCKSLLKRLFGQISSTSPA